MPSLADTRQLTDEQKCLFTRRITQADQEQPGYRRLWRQLETLLLKYGGIGVVPPLSPEPRIEALIDHLSGHRPYTPSEAGYIPGEANSCHTNAAVLWLNATSEDSRHTVNRIGTGYALSEDGLWRQHSWAQAGEFLVETTVERSAYAGVTLTGLDAARFAAENAPEAVLDLPPDILQHRIGAR